MTDSFAGTHGSVALDRVSSERGAAEDQVAKPRLPRRGGRSRQRPRSGAHAIGVIALGVDNPFSSDPAFLGALEGIERALGRSNRSVLLAAVPSARHTPDFLRQRSVEGLIIRIPDAPLARRAAAGALVDRNGLPTMWIFDRVPGAPGDECTCDVDAVGFLAADHFDAMGHRQLAFLNPRQGGRQADAIRDAFGTHVRQSGGTLQLFESPVIPAPWPVPLISSAETVDTLVERWAAVPKRFRATALFVPAAQTAAHVAAALRRRSVRIPEDVSVMACSDSDVLLANLLPAMTTISLHAKLIGERAADALLARITHPHEIGTARWVVEPSLILRQSVAPARG